MDTTISSPTYDSFFTVSEMDAYIEKQALLFTDDQGWSVLTDTQKELYILLTVDYINGFSWDGTRNATIVVSTMQWPRSGLNHPSGEAIDGSVTPDQIGLASACYILSIMSGNVTTPGADIGAIKSKKVGDVTIQYETGSNSSSSTAEIDDDNPCITKNIPTEWLGSISSGGIGYVGLARMP